MCYSSCKSSVVTAAEELGLKITTKVTVYFIIGYNHADKGSWKVVRASKKITVIIIVINNNNTSYEILVFSFKKGHLNCFNHVT
jgi:hypothetical protein